MILKSALIPDEQINNLFLSQLESGYKPHMLVKDSHLKDYDKFFILKRLLSFCSYGVLPYNRSN